MELSDSDKAQEAGEEEKGDLDADGCRRVCTTVWRAGRRVKSCHSACGYYLMELSDSDKAQEAGEEEKGELNTDGCRRVCTTVWRAGRRVKSCHSACGYYLVQLNDDAKDTVADNQEEDEMEAAVQEDGSELTGGKCMNKHDLKIWKSGGKQQYDAAMDHCGTSCAAGFPCTRDCMQKKGYSSGCASCMAHAVECGRDHCLSQCISNHKSKGCLHCNKQKCRPVMKKCSGWAVGGH
jgi:hypothetical protein